MRDILPTLLLLMIAPALPAGEFPASIEIKREQAIGKINPDIYGQYLEHVELHEECIYASISDRAHPKADQFGIRQDTASAVKDLAPPIVRWPGGIFADYYHWENGVGPAAQRPTLSVKHTGGKESHQFGTDEFLQFCRQTGMRPYLNTNLGSGTLEEALAWLEYCNGDVSTPRGKQRAEHGHREPYNVLHWGVGNEVWNPGVPGHIDATSYAEKLSTWAKAMKERDPRIKILGVGSELANDQQWDETVLKTAGKHIDYLTFHGYGYSDRTSETPEQVLYASVVIEQQLRKMIGLARLYSPKPDEPIRISVDEWNIRRFEGKKIRRREPRTMLDALFAAEMLNVFIRLSPDVAMANYVFLVNGHAPILVNKEGVLKTVMFDVFARYGREMTGTAVEVAVDSPLSAAVEQPRLAGPWAMTVRHGVSPSPVIDASAVVRDDGTIAVSIVNRHASDRAAVSFKLPRFEPVVSWQLHHQDSYAADTFEHPETIVPVECQLAAGTQSLVCPPHSLTIVTFRRSQETK